MKLVMLGGPGVTGIAGTNSPLLNKVAPGEYPVNEIWANWVDVKVPVAVPKKILPAVPAEPAVPVHPLMMRVATLLFAQVIALELAKVSVPVPPN